MDHQQHFETSGADDRTRQFLQLLGQHEQALVSYIFLLVPSWSDAEDIAQEVRVRLWDQFDEYDPDRDFGAWSRTIARYLVMAWRKKESRRGLVVMSPEFLDAIESHFDPMVTSRSDRGRALEYCLDRISEASRKLLLDWYAGTQKVREVAASHGKSYDAARKAVLRTRKALAKCVARQLEGGSGQ